MNTLLLGRCLGDLTPQAFQRLYFQQQIQSLGHDVNINFTYHSKSTEESTSQNEGISTAHKAGTNCIAIDQASGRFLISGGADTGISLWDLETPSDGDQTANTVYRPVSTISKATQSSHSHAITSLSIYPFDPIPQTLLTTSYDQSLILHSITQTGITPVHTFPLDFTVHTHSICPVPDSTPLVAVGTSHPAPRLIDLRSALATHSLPGHTGAIYSLAWHPTKSHILVSSSTDGRILVFDIRRATPAFASFDLDDSLGIVEGNPSFSNINATISSRSLPRPTQSRPHLDYTHRAHSAPITGIIFNESGTKVISSSHDQRIRIWDVASGRNDLVHFGPRIRNSRAGELKPSLAPPGTAGGGGAKSGRELLFWPNDDGRGEVHVHDLREGNSIKIMKTQHVVQMRERQNMPSTKRRKGHSGQSATAAAVDRLTSGGRINMIAWRPVWADRSGVVEIYTAHGDGRICAWMTADASQGEEDGELSDEFDEDRDERDDNRNDGGDGEEQEIGMKRKKLSVEEADAERKRKRKRDLIGDLVEGLTKKPITFS